VCKPVGHDVFAPIRETQPPVAALLRHPSDSVSPTPSPPGHPPGGTDLVIAMDAKTPTRAAGPRAAVEYVPCLVVDSTDVDTAGEPFKNDQALALGRGAGAWSSW